MGHSVRNLDAIIVRIPWSHPAEAPQLPASLYFKSPQTVIGHTLEDLSFLLCCRLKAGIGALSRVRQTLDADDTLRPAHAHSLFVFMQSIGK